MTERRSKHVVVLSQFFLPERAPYASSIAKALRDSGYEVTVVTGYPNRPGGKLYAGYKQRPRFSEVIEGLRIHRVPLVINHSRKPLDRALNFLSFSVSALTISINVRHVDAVYVYATPATAAIPAQIWNLLFGIPYVLHVQDLWPESVTDSGMIRNKSLNRLVHKILSAWTNRLYRQSKALIAISAGMRDLLIERGNEAVTTSVVYNWADETTIVPKSNSAFKDGSLRLVYAGNLGPMQDLDTVIAAAALHKELQNFKLTLAGGGILEDTVKTKAEEVEQIEFLGRLSPEEVSQLYLKADFQLVTLKDLPIFRTTVPSKLQASLASGVPVITTVRGSVAELIRQYDAGIVAEPESIGSLSEAFDAAYEMPASRRARMGQNARQLYEDLMSKEAGTSSIVGIMNDVVSESGNTIGEGSRRRG